MNGAMNHPDHDARMRRRWRAITMPIAALAVVSVVLVVAAVTGPPRSQLIAQTEPGSVIEEGSDSQAGKLGKRNHSPAESPSADDFVAVGWRRYVSAGAGFAIEIPADWVPIERDGTTRFRTGAYVVELDVSVGERSGQVTVCNTAPCQTVTVADIEELDAALETFPAGIGGGDFREWTGTSSVDGQGGPCSRAGAQAGLGCRATGQRKRLRHCSG
jgi:hypothetical protein